MSTKIYNGFKFVNPNMVVIRNQLLEFQKEIRDIARNLYAKTLLIDASRIFDVPYVGMGLNNPNEADAKRPLYSAKDAIIKESKEDGNHYSYTDYKFDIVVIPLTRKTTLGLHYNSHREFETALGDKEWYCDYHYQNQTDQPSTISNKKWRQRKKDWDKALGWDAPANRGFMISLQEPYFLHHIRDLPLKSHIPTLKERTYRYAGDVATMRWCKRNKDACPSQILYGYHKSEEYKEDKRKLYDEIKNKLKKRLYLSDLVGANSRGVS